MLHGYGSCAPQMSIIAKYLAQADYEVFAMDMRGHGDSEGKRAHIEKNEDLYNDYW